MTRRAKNWPCVLLLTCLGGCHTESPPALAMAESATVGTDELAEGEEDADEGEQAQVPESASRALWFADGPGREAIIARERRDHEQAKALLDALLAEGSLSPEDRAAAELLRAFESLEDEAWADAAARFARVREVAAFAPIAAQLRVLEAQARLDAQDSAAALALVEDLEPDPAAGIPARARLVKADAQARTMDRAGAVASYRAYLAEADDRSAYEARRKLAVLLLEGEAEDQRAAAELFEGLALDVPLSDYGREASEALTELEKAKVITRDKRARRDFERRRALAELDDLLARRSYGQVISGADRFMKQAKSLAADEGDRCRVLYLKGSAIFKQRKRPASQPVFDQASKHCAKAKDQGREVKSRYQAARGRYAAGKYEDAAARFEALAKDHPDHSYADDALIKAGESWESASKPESARAAYERSLADHPDGDMADEALRRLLVQAFAEQRTQDALALIDAAIASKRVSGDTLAKLHYFRGRALGIAGEQADARAAYVECVRTRPLSYPAMQAMSRLRDQGEEALAEGLAVLESADGAVIPSLELPGTPAAERAQLWASLGLGEQASADLDAGGIGGWPAAAVLAQAGLYAEAQRTLASRGGAWRGEPPTGDRRALWELAHPMPFRALVEQGEAEHDVPSLLTYAVMQTESRFDPGATSWAGARGLIQLMPATAETVAKRLGLKVRSSELYDPAVNLNLGQSYLAGLVSRWQRDNAGGAAALAIPSYNAGPGRTDQWLGERGDWDLDLFIEAIPFDETRHYTQSVLGRWAIYRWIYGSEPAAERMPYIPLEIPQRTG
ncbi:transglycosylase SLT domain-containing protein [Pseudenhygromyxa sp. WMMC2535]|uniref:transglycosylase SLT domain-containing protein n=1 Tax=Pseudenhygromyxa sp. WMMC2535 TaxID=2712867 RepID=UPI001553523C|nr:transglycosylase SLT domain-containing protein [Pseudenhygromyxa sp. WMMC2535]NVB39121.1 transglycosylase SLT domain-containing protein [Pseudenhygromyxa sp. WMMC2535]